MKPRLLVCELHHLGDLVLAVPFLRAARERFDTRLVCRPGASELLRGLIEPDGIIEWNPPWEPDPGLPAGSWPGFLIKLRRLRPAAFACSWPDARAGWIGLLSGAGRRHGFPMNRANYHALHLDWRRKNLRAGRMLEACALGSLYTRPLQRTRADQHRAEDWNQLAASIGLAPDWSPPWWEKDAWPADPELVEWKSAAENRRILAIAPHARLPTKTWPEACFARVASLLAESAAGLDLRFVVVRAPGAAPPVPEWPRNTESRETNSFASLAALLRASDGLLANDSFAGHFAASLGTKVFSIFGSGSPDWFRPWGTGHRFFRVPNCPFHPCIDRCRMPSIICMEAVQPLAVAPLARDWLG